jgi:hypothetical protein
MILMRSHTKLPNVVKTGCSAAGFASYLNGGQKEADQNTDDCHNHEQLDERHAQLNMAILAHSVASQLIQHSERAMADRA